MSFCFLSGVFGFLVVAEFQPDTVGVAAAVVVVVGVASQLGKVRGPITRDLTTSTGPV